jgi:predicted enzyme involved in methoxymalonyl-ACP biosynthesis
LALRDRFGDFGLINVVILRLHEASRVVEIDTFLMSCRVLQRGVEQYAMNRIFEYARTGLYERVIGRYVPTAKNPMVRDFFRQFSFEPVNAPGADGDEYSLSVAEYVPRKVFINEEVEPAMRAQGAARI